jgi:hypothetical protein
MARYHGNKGAVYGSTTGSGTAGPFISLSAWTGDFATDKVEVTAFGDLNKAYVQGLKDIKGTLSGFWDSADDSLFDAADSTDGAKLYLYPASTAPTIYFYGPAWLDASINVSVSGAVTVSANYVANGAWGRKP